MVFLFHGVPLVTSCRVRLNIQLGKDGKAASSLTGSPTVCLAVRAHVVPGEAMAHAILLGDVIVTHWF